MGTHPISSNPSDSGDHRRDKFARERAKAERRKQIHDALTKAGLVKVDGVWKMIGR